MFKEDLIFLTKQNIEHWNKDLEGANPIQVLSYFEGKFGQKITFASSMGLEDQIITQMIAGLSGKISIFTLDTGRLHQETYDLIQKTNSRYKMNIKVIFPDAVDIEKMVIEKGINLFYESIENRKLCCYNRKIKPLSKALKGKCAWITGIRREQAATRSNSSLIEWDDNHGLIKVNPLINWSKKDVSEYIKEYNIPINALHDKGYKSIGCLPCTKAVEPGEDPRSGRWWWENQGHKECGLHLKD